MKKVLVALMVVCLMAGVASAAQKIVVINMQKALDESAAGKDAASKFENLVKEFNKDAEARGADLQNLEKQLQQQAALLSDDARQAKVKEYQQKRAELEAYLKNAGGALKREEKTLVNGVAQEIRNVAIEVAKGKKADMILHKDEGVIWAVDAYDITDEVIKAFDAKWKK